MVAAFNAQFETHITILSTPQVKAHSRIELAEIYYGKLNAGCDEACWKDRLSILRVAPYTADQYGYTYGNQDERPPADYVEEESRPYADQNDTGNYPAHAEAAAAFPLIADERINDQYQSQADEEVLPPPVPGDITLCSQEKQHSQQNQQQPGENRGCAVMTMMPGVSFVSVFLLCRRLFLLCHQPLLI